MKHKDKRHHLLKETKEERLERLKYSSFMRTRVAPNGKAYNRKKQKQLDKREF